MPITQACISNKYMCQYQHMEYLNLSHELKSLEQTHMRMPPAGHGVDLKVLI